MSDARFTGLAVAEPAAEAEVLPLRSTDDAMAPARVTGDAQPRETSWRDLVRRLAKKPAKR